MTSKPAPDPRGGHIRLYWAIIDSNAWRCLAATDQRAYIALARQKLSSNNGDLALPLSVAKMHGIKSQTTLAKSLRALTAVGLIAVTRAGGCSRGGQRLPTLYRLTDFPVFPIPAKHVEQQKATNEWKTVSTLALGHALIAQHEERALTEARTESASRKTKTLVQILDGTSPKNGPVGPLTSPKIGPWPSRPVQKMDEVKKPKSAAKPVLARVSP
jgi:hypothetical protein